MTEAYVLIVEPDEEQAKIAQDAAANAGHLSRIAQSAADAIRIFESEFIGLVILSTELPDMSGHDFFRQISSGLMKVPVILTSGLVSARKAVEAMRAGACDFWFKPLESRQVQEGVERYLQTVESEHVVLEAPRTREVFSLASRVAQTNVSVLVTGESGTGKEVLARYIHGCSPRKTGKFIAVNCAAIPENMLEAVLFGYEKGAFTGAYQSHAGKFEQAQGGTLLLDEISEIELGLQAKLLRVLQEKEVERICGNQTIPLDVRVIATTNRNLREEVQKGNFREDLYYRLNVFPLQMAPLRERQEDIVALASAMIRRHGASRNRLPVLDGAAQNKLKAYHWPGNVREMENVIQRALILAVGDEIDQGAIQYEFDGCREPAQMSVELTSSLESCVKDKEHRVILDALEQFNGNRKKVAENLGISARTLRYKLARMRDEGLDLSSGVGTRYAGTAQAQ